MQYAKHRNDELEVKDKNSVLKNDRYNMDSM